MKLILISLCLAGCSFGNIVKALPSVQNCQKVVYTRIGNQVTIEADCQVPMQNDPLLDIPVMP